MINDLKQNGVIVNVRIMELLGPTKRRCYDPSFRCEFEYKKEHKNLISPSSIRKDAYSYVGQLYPALYSEKTNTLRLLLTEEDFQEYDQKYPDSLLKKSFQ